MSRSDIDTRSAAITEDLVALHSKWAAEVDMGNIAAANRVVRKIMRMVDTLTKTPGDRRLLEQLLESEVSYLQLWAAAKVKEWDAVLALPVLAKLI